jgi:hypothetical protein
MTRHSSSARHRAQQEAPTKTLWKLWDIGVALLGAAMALEATGVFPWSYWPGVGLVYLGLVFLSWDGFRGRLFENKLGRFAVGSAALIAIVFWTTKVVLADAHLDLQASAWMGDYPAGTNVGGFSWEEHDEDTRVYLVNTTDYDFEDVDLTLTSDLWLMGGAQLEQICPDLQIFRGPANTTLQLADGTIEGKDSAGKPVQIPLPRPLDLSAPTGLRLRCSKIPRRSTTPLVVVTIAYNQAHAAALAPTLFAPKRLPNWLTVKGEYRALGRTRNVAFDKDFP